VLVKIRRPLCASMVVKSSGEMDGKRVIEGLRETFQPLRAPLPRGLVKSAAGSRYLSK